MPEPLENELPFRAATMTDAMIISSVALGISVLVWAVKVINWYAYADPKTVIKTGRWLLKGLALSLVPLLLLLVFNARWSLAMLLAASILFVSTLLSWRALLHPLEAAVRLFRRDHGHAEMLDSELRYRRLEDPELIRHSAAVLEAYLDRAAGDTWRNRGSRPRGPRKAINGRSWNGPMSEEEALEILGLDASAVASEIREAHRRLVQIIHPDRGGSNYLTAKINEAKDTLLGGAVVRSSSAPNGSSRKPKGRRKSARDTPPQTGTSA